MAVDNRRVMAYSEPMLTSSGFVRLCRARERLREVHDRPVSIRDVARDAEMSTFQLTRHFHALFGQTPHQFRIQARLDRARELLALSDYSVTDVSMEVGFSSLGSFSDLFARRVGAAPSLYRRQVRTLIQVPGTRMGPVSIAVCADTCGNLIQLYQPT